MNYSQDIFWTNLKGGKNKIIKNLGFLEYDLGALFLRLRNPSFIWTGTGRIHPLENLILDSKIQNKNKNREFYFFLYEPLCARIGDYNRSFYSEFKSTDNIKDFVSDEIESIKIFVKNNNISKFRILTTDYNIQLLEAVYPDIKLSCLDLFIRSISNNYCKIQNLNNNISKKFWCGNWRYTVHRHLICSYVSQLSGVYSWNLKCSWDELKKNNWFDLTLLEKENADQYLQLKEGVDVLEKSVLCIDQKTDSLNVDNFENVFIPGQSAPKFTEQLLASYKSCFCAIVNETRYAQPFGNFSEKTLAPISAKLPFILVAPPYTLEYLKTFGFKTFSEWWDESYDQEQDHYQRMIKIFNLIDFINSKSIDELKLIYQEMQSVLSYNQEILKTIALNDKIL